MGHPHLFRLLFLIVVVLNAVTPTFSQNAQITGRVIDAKSGSG
jgi:hypothetical protein